ncbi:hypothetical protein [Cryptosporangium japonicum]|uniref:hypothetical protein n=1 Tax=Cryptosporangium japonicum TaxID=80872 RepID=UPI0031CF25FA
MNGRFGALIIALGWVLICCAAPVAGAVTTVAVGESIGDDSVGAVAGGLSTMPLLAVGVLLAVRGRRRRWMRRRLRTPAPTSVSDLPAGPFVLYLRSFGSDDAAARPNAAPVSTLWVRGRTEEEELARVFERAGRVVAVARPGEDVPHVGAYRYAIADADWQFEVRRLMSAARLVVLALGSTAGLRWELERAFESLPPERLVLLIPGGEPTYEEFRRTAPGPARTAYPRYPTGKSITSSWVKSVVRFDPDWSPQVQRIDTKYLVGVNSAPIESTVGYAVGPVLHRIGAPAAAFGLTVVPRRRWAVPRRVVPVLQVALFTVLVVGSVVVLGAVLTLG